MVVEQVLRQTGGSSKVSSRGAVFDSDRRPWSRGFSLAGRTCTFHLNYSSSIPAGRKERFANHRDAEESFAWAVPEVDGQKRGKR